LDQPRRVGVRVGRGQAQYTGVMSVATKHEIQPRLGPALHGRLGHQLTREGSAKSFSLITEGGQRVMTHHGAHSLVGGTGECRLDVRYLLLVQGPALVSKHARRVDEDQAKGA